MITKILFTSLLFVSFNLLAGDITKDICDYLDYNDYVYREYPYQNTKSEQEIKEMRELHSDLKKNMICGKLRKKVKFDYYSDVYLNNPVATIYFEHNATEDEKRFMKTMLELRERTIDLKKTFIFWGEVISSKLGKMVQLLYYNNIIPMGKVDDFANGQYLPLLNETCGDLMFGDKVYRNLTIMNSLAQLRGTVLAFQNVARDTFIPSKKMMIKNMDYVLSGSINPGPWSDERYTYADFAGLDRVINCFQNKVIFGQRLPESKKIF